MSAARICSFTLLLISTISFAQQPRLVLPIGHTDLIESANFSPDGKRIVTSSRDRTVKIWDAISGYLLANLNHPGNVISAEFSLDGKKIVTGSESKPSNLWDPVADRLLVQHVANPDSVELAQTSPDGKKIFIFYQNGTKIVCDAISGKRLVDLKEFPGFVRWAQFSRDGRKIVTISAGGMKAMVWDAVSGKLLKPLMGDSDIIRSAQFSPDGKKIITILKNQSGISIWDAVTGSRLAKISESIISAQFNSNGKKILTTGVRVCLWDGASGKWIVDREIIIDKNERYTYFAQLSPDEKKIITTTYETYDNVARIYDAVSGNLLLKLRGYTDAVNFAQFSPDGKKILTASNDKKIRIWDVYSGKMSAILKGHTKGVFIAMFSPDGTKIVSSSEDNSVRIWEANSGNQLVSLKKNNSLATILQFSPDSKKIVTAGPNNYSTGPFSNDAYDVRVWDAFSGDIVRTLRGHTNEVKSVEFSQDGKKIVTSSTDKTVRVWNVDTGNMDFILKGHSGIVVSAKFSPDGKKIVTASYDNTAKIWNAVSGNLIAILGGHKYGVNSAEFSPDGKRVITASDDTIAYIWDATKGDFPGSIHSNGRKIVYIKFSLQGNKIVTSDTWGSNVSIWNAFSGNFQADLIGHTNKLQSVEISPDGKKIVTAADDNTCKVWSMDSAKILYTFFAVGDNDYFAQSRDGYYETTPAASKLLHYVTKDLNVITFDQLDIKYNRPDKVLEAIGNTDTALIKSYRKAYEKRIKKLGIDTTAFRDGYSVPEADFTNRDAIDYEQKNGTLKLLIKGNDSSYKLDRFNVWVNETPIYGQRGINIRRRNKNDFDSTIILKLSQGENRIETSITNVNGTESYRMPLIVNYTPAVKQKETTRFIGIGIDRFADNQYNLQYSSKDIRDLSKKLKEKYKDDIIIDTLFNENVTISNVKALKQKLQQTTENDKVIIAYSGHGMLSKDYNYYLSTYTVNFNKPEENGLPYDELESLLDSIPARKKLMLIDACHSGEVDKDDLITLNASSDSLIKGLKPVAYKKEGHLGLKNSFELMQSLFVNVGKSTGATIISAAAGTQFALERNDLKNGVFTYSILEAMKKYPTLKISELKKIVGERVEQLTNGLQKPTSRNETIAVDWNIW